MYIKRENLWNKLCYIEGLNLKVILQMNRNVNLVGFENCWGFNNNRILEIECDKLGNIVDYNCYSSNSTIDVEVSHIITNEDLININGSTSERNDYCPCGSSKKYKKCCGRFA